MADPTEQGELMSAKALFQSIIDAGWAGVQAWVDTKQEESLCLEFKQKHPGSPALNDNDWGQLAIAMSAFANAEGGVYVFGVKTSQQGKNFPDRVERVTSLPKIDGFKGAFERRLHLLTEPPIHGMEVNTVTSTDDPDRGIVVVYIPKSETGPHCTRAGLDKSIGHYYMRCNVTTIQVHHGLLASMFGRQPSPNIYLVCIYRITPTHSAIELIIGNNGRGYAERPAIRFDQLIPGFDDTDSIQTQPTLSHVSGEWMRSMMHAGFSNGAGIFFRGTGNVTLYPGLELAVCITEGKHFHNKPYFHLSLRGSLYSLNMKSIPFNCSVPLRTPGHGSRSGRITLSKDEETGVLSVVTRDANDDTEWLDRG